MDDLEKQTKEEILEEFKDKYPRLWQECKSWTGLTSGNNITGYMSVEEDIKDFLSKSLDSIYQAGVDSKITGETSDGYHTFNELYEFRKIYNAVLFNEWASQGKYNVHKSKRHSDGEECFGGGWFIVMAGLPAGQISNHYELKDWDLFQCEEREFADRWDGHTPQDVVIRLSQLQPLSEERENENNQ